VITLAKRLTNGGQAVPQAGPSAKERALPDHIRILGISGSLRRGSLNTAALQAASSLAPDGVEVEIAQIRDLPHYDEDVRQAGLPAPVARLREQVRGADALLIACPEYNHGIPGVLKNAIDWLSRPPEQPFAGKPVACLGVSPGRFGTARAQMQLRDVLFALGVLLLPRQPLLIGESKQAFDDAGQLVDEATRDRLAGLVQALADWSRLHAGAGA
jgi:chromate reductase